MLFWNNFSYSIDLSKQKREKYQCPFFQWQDPNSKIIWAAGNCWTSKKEEFYQFKSKQPFDTNINELTLRIKDQGLFKWNSCHSWRFDHQWCNWRKNKQEFSWCYSARRGTLKNKRKNKKNNKKHSSEIKQRSSLFTVTKVFSV